MSRSNTAVVYARYSSHKQGEQSIEGQLAEAYKYADEHGLKIIHEYVDRATTGRTDNREQFQRMLKDTAKNQFSIIICWKVDRFGRSREEIAINKSKCKRNGVRVEYIAETIPKTNEGVILESVLEGMAEYYSLQLSENIRRGQRASAEKCQHVGGSPPLGYLVDPDTKRLVINPKTAPTVQLAFELYTQGLPVSKVTEELNRRGLRTVRGRKFTKNSLYSVLSNERYTGVYIFKDLVRTEGGVPEIIDAETFKKAQEMLKVNKKAPVHSWNCADYILTDKLFCGLCGSKMIGESGTSRSGKKHNYYACIGRKRKRICNKRAVRKSWIEGIVLGRIVSILQNDKLLNDISEGVYEYYKEQQNDDDLKTSLKNKLAEVEKAQANIINAIEAGLFGRITKKRMDELEVQREEIEDELKQLELVRSWRLTKEHILFFLCAMRDKDMKDPDCQRQLIDTFINAVFVYDDKITITFNYSGDDRTVTLDEVDSLAPEGSEGGVFDCCWSSSTNQQFGSMHNPAFF